MRNPLPHHPAVLRARGVATIAAIGFGLLGAAPAGAGQPDRHELPRAAQADRHVVVYEDVAHPAGETRRLERALGFRSVFRYDAALEGFAARLSPGQLRAVERNPSVAYVSPDYQVEATGAAPLASGESLPPTGVRRIEAASTSAAHEASGARVAVLDTGIDLDHPDLNAVDGRNCVDTGAPADDDNGHGTHVAGSIGAKNNGSGLVGVAPGTRVVAVKVLDAAGEGTFSQIICGIDWVTATRTDSDPANDVEVANLSLGGPGEPVGSCATTTDPLHQAICRSTAARTAYVVAAGNSGWDFDYQPVPDLPAAYPEVLTVTAISDSDGLAGGTGGAPACASSERDDRYASFSNYAATQAGAAHTVAAPGTCVDSTWPGGGYRTISGTSMATPHVAGATALCMSDGSVAGPCAGLPAAEIVQRMRSDAQAQTADKPAYGFAGDPTRPVSGRYYGYLTFAPLAISDGTAPAEPEEPAEPTYSDVTASPFATVVQAGAVRSGTHARLAADDGSYFQVNSTTSGTRTSAWYGRFSGVSDDLRNLRVAYSGKNSATCSQTLAVWRWTTSSWVQIDSRSVGGIEVAVEAIPSGTLADYVSGTSGDGETRVRVRCTRKSPSFHMSADHLALAYQEPTG